MPRTGSITVWFQVLIIGILIFGCGLQTSKISGVVVDVRADSLLKFESIEIRDAEGVIWHLLGDDFKSQPTTHSFTPSHIREHMLHGLPITVWYKEDKTGRLLITAIQD